MSAAVELNVFFENKTLAEEHFSDGGKPLGQKRSLLGALRELASESDDETKVIQFRDYCAITEKAHPKEVGSDYDKVSPGYANIKLGSCML